MFVFVFVLLCLVDKKGQENARKSGHVFLCLNLNLCSLEFLLKMKDLVCYYVHCVFKFEFVFGSGFVLLCFCVDI